MLSLLLLLSSVVVFGIVVIVCGNDAAYVVMFARICDVVVGGVVAINVGHACVRVCVATG